MSGDEADAAARFGAHLDVGDGCCGHDVQLAFRVAQLDDPGALLDRGGHGLRDAFGGFGGFEHDLAVGVLDADVNLHAVRVLRR